MTYLLAGRTKPLDLESSPLPRSETIGTGRKREMKIDEGGRGNAEGKKMRKDEEETRREEGSMKRRSCRGRERS